MTLLSHLVSKFRKKGETEQADRLYDILRLTVERSNIFADKETKKAYMDDFEEKAKQKE